MSLGLVEVKLVVVKGLSVNPGRCVSRPLWGVELAAQLGEAVCPARPRYGHVSLDPGWRSAVSGGLSRGGQAHYPASAWRVNYTVGWVGQVHRAEPRVKGEDEEEEAACRRHGGIHLTKVSFGSFFMPCVWELLGKASVSHPLPLSLSPSLSFLIPLPPHSLTNNYSVGHLTRVMDLEEDVSLKD